MPDHDLNRIGPRVPINVDHLDRLPVHQPFIGFGYRFKLWLVYGRYIIFSGTAARDLAVVDGPEPGLTLAVAGDGDSTGAARVAGDGVAGAPQAASQNIPGKGNSRISLGKSPFMT